jgi:hypothetical protein
MDGKYLALFAIVAGIALLIGASRSGLGRDLDRLPLIILMVLAGAALIIGGCVYLLMRALAAL